MKKYLLVMAILCIILASTALAYMPKGVEVTEYDDDTNYMKLMLEAAKDGSTNALSMGAIYEEQRNMKIVSQQLTQSTTNIFTGYKNVNEIRVLLQDYSDPVKPPATPEITYYTDSDATMIAKTIYNEARGIDNKIELACVAWTILNRVDAGYGTISEVITARNQFAYSSSAPTVNDHGVDLLELSYDVLDRWNKEKNGEANVGRVLSSDYLWYSGDSDHNYFRNAYGGGTRWNYSLPNPYEIQI